jgi:hypothetical protein
VLCSFAAFVAFAAFVVTLGNPTVRVTTKGQAMSEQSCPSCGKRISEATRFCPECGSRLPEANPSAPVGVPATVRLPSLDPPTADIPPTQRLDEAEPAPAAAPDVTAPAWAATQSLPAQSPATPSGEPPETTAPPVADTAPAWNVPPPPAATGAEPDGAHSAAPQPPSGAPAQPVNNKTLWWIVGGGSCLAIIVVGACVALGVLTLLGSRTADSPPSVVTTTSPGSGGGIVPTTSPGGGGIVPLDSPITGGAVLLRENFDQPASSVVSSSDNEFARYSFEDGRFAITLKAPERIAWTMVGGPYDNVRINIDTQVSPDDPVAAAGLIFNHQDDDNFYLFSVASDGFYSLEVLVEDEWFVLIDWTPSDLINEVNNRMGVTTNGDRIALYINDRLLEETRDGTFVGGDAGIALTSFDGAPTTVRFDNLVITRNQ